MAKTIWRKIVSGNILPILFLVIVFIGFFYKFFFKGLIPIPADLMTGVYYPWLDYKWGYPNGIPVYNPSISDIYSQFYPWKYLIVDIFKKSEIPLWNQYSFSGVPLLGNYHSGVLFPFNLILFLPNQISWGLYIFGQYLVASIGMYLLLNYYVKNKYLKLIGAIIFSTSGLMTTWAEFGTGVWATAFIPWIIFFIKKFIASLNIQNLVGMAIGYTTLIFAGNAQVTLYTGILVVLFILYQLFVNKISKLNTIILCVYLFISVGISLIQLLPAYEQSQLSVRSVEKSYIVNENYGLTPWYDFIRLYSSDFFGHPTTYNYWGDISYYENSSFISTLGFIFIFIILIYKINNIKDIYFYKIIFIGSIVLALDNPVTAFLYRQQFPLFTYSLASRILFITSFCTGILVPISIEKFSEIKYKKRVIIYSLIFILLIFTSLLVLIILNIDIKYIKISFKNSVIPIMMISSLLTITFLNIKQKYLFPILLVLITFDLGRYFIKFNPFVDSKIIFPNTPAINFLNAQSGTFRIGRLNRQTMTPNTWIPYHLSSVEGYDPLALENYSRYFNKLNSGQYTDNITRFSEIFSNPDINYLSSLNTKYLISMENVHSTTYPPQIQNNIKKVFQDKSTIIYENLQNKGRIYYVNKVTGVNDYIQLTNIINKSNFNPISEAIVIDKDINKLKFNTGTLDNINIRNNKIQFTTNNQTYGFLVIANTYTNGWNAKINNQVTKLYQVNGGLTGIIVPSGTNYIELYYWPKSVKQGLFISAISLLSLIILSIYFRKNNEWRKIFG